MGHGVDAGNIIVGFGGVFLLGVIAVVVWFLLPPEDDEETTDAHPSSADSARHPAR